MSSVVVIDYGVGNLRSVSRALEVAGASAVVSSDAAVIRGADRLVLPGVGAFGACVEALRETGLHEQVLRYAETGRPLLGICVGMQILFDRGTEFGGGAGLGLIDGIVDRFSNVKSDGRRIKTPFIGWSRLSRPEGGNSWQATPLALTREGESVYFVHSFAAVPKAPNRVLAYTDYGCGPVCAVVAQDALFGVQFHPERSGPTGLRVMESFLAL